MQKIRVNLPLTPYDVLVGRSLSENMDAQHELARLVRGKRVHVISDSNVASLHGSNLRDRLVSSGASGVSESLFPAGEPAKRLSTIEKFCSDAARAGLDRGSVFVGLGGGVTGDMAAFTASLYMRGVDFIQIPTSLLAMIDSAIGGKTGVDIPERKNLAGTFYQPKLVLMNTSYLETLPPSEIRCGCAELIKHAILFDPALFQTLEPQIPDIAAWPELVGRSCELKAAVVEQDEREHGRRALLNLGHTFAHAVESAQHFSGLSHGDAVAVGLRIAARLARREALFPESDEHAIQTLLDRYGFPARVPSGLDPDDLLRRMYGDKKTVGGQLRLILPRQIGNAEIVNNLPDKVIRAAIGEFCD